MSGVADGWDIIVVGAGAAGLTAAIFAAQRARELKSPLRVVALDGAKALGAKILVSGGGRCNVTNQVVRPADYSGSKNIVRNVLAAFDEGATVAWFESMGVRLKREETGKLFPTSDSARTVLDGLLRRCAALDVDVRGGHRVNAIERGDGGGFLVRHEGGELSARQVILATGGRSLPKTGSDGFGYSLARALGHGVTETYPALVPLVLEDGFFHKELSGLSHEAALSTVAGGRAVDGRAGSLLWTHFGISGPLAMDASRHWLIAASTAGVRVELRCNLLVDRTADQAERWLIEQATASPRASLRIVIARRLPERLADVLVRHAGGDPNAPAGQLTREGRALLGRALTSLVLPVVRDRGWNYAEVTAGGVPLGEIDYRTMASRKSPGAYLVGEILDCDGRIGGFNFQWAWSTGYLAGRAAGAAAVATARV